MNDEKPVDPAKLTPEQLKTIEDFNIGGPEFTITEQVAIPESAAQKWTSISADQSIVISLTRGDFDRLYFSLTQLSAALTCSQQTMRFVSYGDTSAADVSFRKGNELIQSADGNFRLFFKAIMEKAVPNG